MIFYFFFFLLNKNVRKKWQVNENCFCLIKKIKRFFFLSRHIHFEISPNFCEQRTSFHLKKGTWKLRDFSIKKTFTAISWSSPSTKLLLSTKFIHISKNNRDIYYVVHPVYSIMVENWLKIKTKYTSVELTELSYRSHYKLLLSLCLYSIPCTWI